VRTTLEDRKKQYRIIYELLLKKSRIPIKDISKIVGSYVAKKRMEEAFGQQYIIGPDIRKRSFSNLREYMYFVNCENPELAYLKYREDERIIYHAQMSGFCDLWIISRKEIDIDGKIILKGPRSDYYTSYASDRSWEKSLEIMRKKIESFNPKKYAPKHYIQTHFNESIEWDEEDELLYRYFKYDLRKPLAPVMRKHAISGGKLYKFLERLPETCTIATSYYPETLSAYDHYLFAFNTDYEDFIIELFSELPATISFFKVSDKLFIYTQISKMFFEISDSPDLNLYYLPLLVIELLRKKIVNKKEHAITMYFKGKSL
jgi:hypothetical protein